MGKVYILRNCKANKKTIALEETLFHNANGYIGIRNSPEEGGGIRGQYINGFYEIVPMKQAEKLANVPQQKESIISVADTQGLRFCAKGEWFDPFKGTLLSCQRSLDMEAGVTERSIIWRSEKGRKIKLIFRRMASFQEPSLFTIDCTFVPLNFSGETEIESSHLGIVKSYFDPSDPRLSSGRRRNLTALGWKMISNGSFLSARTRKSRLSLTSGIRHWFSIKPEAEESFYDAKRHASFFKYRFRLEKNQALRLVKYCVFADSRKYEDTMEAAVALMKRLYGSLDELYVSQRRILKDFWENAELTAEGDEEADTALNFSVYQLFQATGENGLYGIPAKGLSGEGYEGHRFWDTEMYMMPFFILTLPSVARKLLGYRYAMLDKARQNARRLGHKKGALFPWRTISGTECSGYFPAGSAQYHINGDIAHAVVSYYEATEDRDYMIREGAEILLETARLWLEAGVWHNGRFMINCVTGPDEYTCLVNNNYYTNASAKFNLEQAKKIMEKLKDWGVFDAWANRVGLQSGESEAFEKAGSQMYLPFDKELGINPQDDSFLQKKPWDFDNTPPEKHPLLLHCHPLELYRSQVCKQPDTVLAHIMFGGLETYETQRRSFEYYEKITTCDSSLSNCILCIGACRLGLWNKADKYLEKSLETDLSDMGLNAKDGLHLANMGGCYMAVVHGYAGLRTGEDGVSVNPFLPKKWSGFSFRFQFRGSRLCFKMEGSFYKVTLLSGKSVWVSTPDGKRLLQNPGDRVGNWSSS